MKSPPHRWLLIASVSVLPVGSDSRVVPGGRQGRSGSRTCYRPGSGLQAREAGMSYPSWDMIRNGTFVRTRNFPLIAADVVIIGAPYVASWQEYAGVAKSEWIAGPKRVRQQSIRYATGYIQDLDIDVFEHLRVVDFGDANIPPEV